jgi:hypothetical protein
LAKKYLVKSLLISTLGKSLYYKGTFLQGSTKPLYTLQNRLETMQMKKFTLFQHPSSCTEISMLQTIFSGYVTHNNSRQNKLFLSARETVAKHNGRIFLIGIEHNFLQVIIA